jgi:hypothetical protein
MKVKRKMQFIVFLEMCKQKFKVTEFEFPTKSFFSIPFNFTAKNQQLQGFKTITMPIKLKFKTKTMLIKLNSKQKQST